MVACAALYRGRRIGLLKTVVIILHALFAVGLIAGVLLQSGKEAGLSGAIAGGAQSFFGKKKGLDDLLGKVSAFFAIAFMISALLLTVLES